MRIKKKKLPRVAPLAAFLLGFAWISAGSAGAAERPALSAEERRIAERVDSFFEYDVALLERTVNINSGTLNHEGVRQVAEALAPEFEQLGFETRWVPLPPETERAGHLIAERRGGRGKRLLLIGHLDTVFEKDSPFQRFERDGDRARGPGIADMKGGNIVMLSALRALHQEGALEGTTITVILTGDEEAPGRPLEISRRDLFDAGRRSDIALGFEAGARDGTGQEYGVIARRSSSFWKLEVRAMPAHSMTIFSESAGAGAIYEASRIIDRFYRELKEENLTYNVGMIAGGTLVTYDSATSTGTAFGKTNVIPASVIATGDIRTLTDDQLARTRERMQAILSESLPRASARITFDDGYPSMPPTPANEALLSKFDEVSRALGYGPIKAFDPASRGAADIAFVARYVEAGLDGLGIHGSGGHTVNEEADLSSIPVAAKRAAVLIHRLTQ